MWRPLGTCPVCPVLNPALNPGLRFSAFSRDLQCTPKDVLGVDETVSTLYVDTRVPESTCYKIIKPLVDDHPVLRPLQCEFEGGRKRGVLLYYNIGPL